MLHVVFVLIVIGILLYLVNQHLPMDGKIKNILNIVVVVAVILWLLSVFGLFSMIHDVPVPKVNR